MRTRKDSEQAEVKKLTLWKAHRRDRWGHGRKVNEQGTLTFWRAYRKGEVRTWEESERARGTHFLKSASGSISEDTKRKRTSEGHSLSREPARME